MYVGRTRLEAESLRRCPGTAVLFLRFRASNIQLFSFKYRCYRALFPSHQCCRNIMLTSSMLGRFVQQCSPLWRPWSASLRRVREPDWRRTYSLRTGDASNEGLPGLDPSKLSITQTITPKDLVPPEQLIFGRNFTGMAPLGQYAWMVD